MNLISPVKGERPVWMAHDAPGKECQHCHYFLPFSYFPMSKTQGRSPMCDVCRDAIRQDRPWTDEQNKRVREAGRQVIDCWPRLIDVLTEEDRIAFRALLAALDRGIE